jgi:dipeptidyl aminopeptidase/acylaminoacyl peptidase
MPKRPISIEDLAALKLAGDPQISPDGAHVLFTVKQTSVEKNKYFTHLWLSDAAGGGNGVQFTFGEVGDVSPRWSPDGRQIVFVRTRERKTQLWLLARDGGEPHALTDLPEGASGDVRWSPDGRHIAFTFRPSGAEWTRDAAKKREESGMSKPPHVLKRVRYRLDGAGFQDERQHIWVCNAANGRAKSITGGDHDDSSPAWSPDSRTIAFASNRVPDADRHSYRSDIWLVPAKGGKARIVAAPVGSKTALAWSPDGSQIAYIGNECAADPWLPKNNRLWVVPVEGGETRCLSMGLDRNIGDSTLADVREGGPALPVWSPDGSHIFVTVSDSGNAHIGAADAASGELKLLSRGAFDAAGFTVDASGTRFAVLLGRTDRPADIHAGELADGQDDPSVLHPVDAGRFGGRARGLSPQAGGKLTLHRLTNLNGPWLKGVQVSAPEEFWLTQPDGTQVQGWIIRPPAQVLQTRARRRGTLEASRPPDFQKSKKYPCLLYVHGGPHSQYGNTFFHELQVHAARGYVVVYGNPRGSNGRDAEFGACVHRNWGHLDYDDVMALANHADALPYVDKNRMAIAGGSYGGFMTNWTVGHTQRFKAGVTDRSICNWLSMVGTTDIAPPPGGMWPGNPWGDDMQKGWDMSPLKFIEQVRTPLLIIHSEGDLRCPIAQSEEWFTALKWLKQEAEFVRYPQETSHGLSRNGPIDLRFDRLRRIGDWLDQHLKTTKARSKDATNTKKKTRKPAAKTLRKGFASLR